MKMRRAILACAIFLLVAGIGLWFATMPYSIETWWEACFSVRYSDKWPISEKDFATANRLVKQQLEWREIITKVTVTGPNEIRIHTTCRWEHALSGNGRVFIVRKVNGEWMVAKWLLWMA